MRHIGPIWLKDNSSSLEIKSSHNGQLANYRKRLSPLVGGLRWTLSRSRLQPNLVQNLPLIGGLCLAADFDQMWFKMCPSSEDFVTLWTFDQMWSEMYPSLEDFLTPRTLFSYGLTYAAAQKNDNHIREVGVNQWYPVSFDVDRSYEDQKPPDSVRVIEPKTEKMTHITYTRRRKTNENDTPHKQQSMPNDAALYIDVIGNGFIAFTWTI